MAAELFRLLSPAALLGAVIGVLLQTPAKAAAVDIELVLAVDAGNGAGGVVGGQVEREPKARPNAAASTTHAERNVKPRLQPVAKNLETILTNIISGLLLLFIIGLAAVTVWEATRDTVFIDPIQVPKDIADKGYTPEVVAKRLIDEALAIRREAMTAKEMRGVTPEWTRADIQMPGAGLSIKSVVRYLKDLLRLRGTRIGGEIIRDGKHLLFRLRARSDSLVVMDVPAHPEDELNKLIHLGAREVMKAIDPFILASYFYDMRDSEASLKLINICLHNKRKDDDIWAYNLWGIILDDQRDYDGAIEKFRKAIEIDPKFARAYSNWGVSLQNKGEDDGAIEKYQKALKIDPKFALAYGAWGYTLHNKGKYNDAIKKYQKTIEIDPKSTLAYAFWGDTLRAQGDNNGAIKKYQKALVLDPKNFEYLKDNIKHLKAERSGG